MTEYAEHWKPVVEFEGIYEVSDHGQVRNIADRARTTINQVLKPQKHNHGYLFVVLSNGRAKQKRKYIHHLVMEAFVGPRPAEYETNHLDGDKGNNRLGNLEYCTALENHQHASRTRLAAFGDRNGSRKFPERLPRGQANWMTKLKDEEVSEIKHLLKTGVPQAKIGQRFDIAQSVVCRINTGQIWRHVT